MYKNVSLNFLKKTVRVWMKQIKKIVTPPYIKQDASLPRAVIFDLDGTLALGNQRGAFEWFKVYDDAVNDPVANLLYSLIETGRYNIIFMSGRDECCREQTKKWIADKLLGEKYNMDIVLHMRPLHDRRKDSIVKKELYETHVKDKFFVEFICDDRDSVVSLWRRELGLHCFQVEYGDF